MTMLTDWNANEVQWFDNFEKLWGEHEKVNLLDEIDRIGNLLDTKLGLPICMLSSEQSKFFKRHYSTNRHNLGPLVKEIDVIRKIEGW
jgi:hypothetical protein